MWKPADSVLLYLPESFDDIGALLRHDDRGLGENDDRENRDREREEKD